MRDVVEARGKGDFSNGLVSRVAVKKLARACGNPLLVEVLPHRAACCRKETVHIALGAAESCGQCCRAKLRGVAVTIDMVKHHRQQHGDMHALHGHIGENFRRMRIRSTTCAPISAEVFGS